MIIWHVFLIKCLHLRVLLWLLIEGTCACCLDILAALGQSCDSMGAATVTRAWGRSEGTLLLAPVLAAQTGHINASGANCFYNRRRYPLLCMLITPQRFYNTLLRRNDDFSPFMDFLSDYLIQWNFDAASVLHVYWRRPSKEELLAWPCCYTS